MLKVENKWYLTSKERLKFFHFSQYEYHNPYSISKFQKRHTIQQRSDVKELIDDYQHLLVQNKFEEFNKCSCFYQQIYIDHVSKVRASERSLVKKLTRRLNRYIGRTKKLSLYAI